MPGKCSLFHWCIILFHCNQLPSDFVFSLQTPNGAINIFSNNRCWTQWVHWAGRTPIGCTGGHIPPIAVSLLISGFMFFFPFQSSQTIEGAAVSASHAVCCLREWGKELNCLKHIYSLWCKFNDLILGTKQPGSWSASLANVSVHEIMSAWNTEGSSKWNRGNKLSVAHD